MNFYTVKEVMQLTGLKQTGGYDLIKKLQKKIKLEYPGTIVITGKIQKWYFDEKVLPIRKEAKNEEA